MANITKAQLENLYIDQGLSIRKCAEELGLPTYGSISGMLKRFGIPTRKGRFQKGKSQNFHKKGDKASGWKGGKANVECNKCGKVIKKFKSLVQEQNFCSTKCFHDSRRTDDIISQRFGELVVIRYSGYDKHRHLQYLCKCDCGVEKVVLKSSLIRGFTTSCGGSVHHSGDKSCAWKGGKIEVECGNPDCKKTKWIYEARKKQYETFYCSKECFGTFTKSRFTGSNNPNWLEGFCGYDTYKDQLGFAEKVRRDPKNEQILQVKCVNCEQWFRPKKGQVSARIRVLYDQKGAAGSSYFYCSDECKTSCSVFRKIRHPEGHNPRSKYRQETLDPDLNTLVLNRDSYQCQKCGACTELEVHHIEGVAQEPMLANDLDNCITVCHSCHKAIHSQPGCTYHDYQREACEPDSKGAVINQ